MTFTIINSVKNIKPKPKPPLLTFSFHLIQASKQYLDIKVIIVERQFQVWRWGRRRW